MDTVTDNKQPPPRGEKLHELLREWRRIEAILKRLDKKTK